MTKIKAGMTRGKALFNLPFSEREKYGLFVNKGPGYRLSPVCNDSHA
jgi:hypothetical protein